MNRKRTHWFILIEAATDFIHITLAAALTVAVVAVAGWYVVTAIMQFK